MASSTSFEKLLHLYDHYWLNQNIMTAYTPNHVNTHDSKKPTPNMPSQSSNILGRSFSEQCLSSLADSLSSNGNVSPDSVLATTSKQLHTIFSGKECKHFAEKNEEEKQGRKNRGIAVKKRFRRQKSKSLSELEFEELKGFMDLGFVFSEEDKDSSLATIIPGLQRLGKMHNHDNNDDEEQKCGVSRPYLSETWETLEEKNVVNPLIYWRIPSDLVSNETDMKNHLKFWAHTVAAAVR